MKTTGRAPGGIISRGGCSAPLGFTRRAHEDGADASSIQAQRPGRAAKMRAKGGSFCRDHFVGFPGRASGGALPLLARFAHCSDDYAPAARLRVKLLTSRGANSTRVPPPATSTNFEKRTVSAPPPRVAMPTVIFAQKGKDQGQSTAAPVHDAGVVPARPTAAG